MESSPAVSFITDVEGDIDYFTKVVNSSAVLRFDADGSLDFVPQAKGEAPSRFVFGGDLFDRGPGDIRLSRLLCAFKDRHPERVVLLLGNRDLNKIRFSSELYLDVAPEDAFSAFWDARAPSYGEYMEKNPEDSAVNRCRWMLKHTLGCPNTFELRREELRLLRKEEGDVTDEMVAESFRDGVEAESGFYHEYLKRGQLAARIENVLFVHGAADSRGLGFVPDVEVKFAANSEEQVTGTHFPALDEWVEELNRFKERALQHWRAQLRWNGRRRGGEALLAYQNKPAMHGKTVCVHSYVDGKNMPLPAAYEGGPHRSGFELRSNPFDPKAKEYLSAGGIRKVLVGHTPSGEASAVLLFDDGFEIVSADCNYAEADGTRGTCWVEVVLQRDGKTRLRGQTKVSKRYDCVVAPPIGTQRKWNGELWWVKLQTEDGLFLLSRGEGRKSESQFVSRDEFE